MCKEKNGLPAKNAFLYNKVIRDIYILITEKKFVVKIFIKFSPNDLDELTRSIILGRKMNVA